MTKWPSQLIRYFRKPLYYKIEECGKTTNFHLMEFNAKLQRKKKILL